MKNILLYSVVFLFSLISLASVLHAVKTNVSKLQNRDGIFYEGGSDTPFTGTAILKNRFSDDIISANVPEYFKNGRRDGEYEEWDLSGRNRFVYKYKSGILHGPQVAWNAKGQKTFQYNYKNGVLNGEFFEWFDDGGEKERHGFFKLGKEDGKWTSWYQNGSMKSMGLYKNGLKTGRWLFWVKDDKDKQVIYYEDGKEKYEKTGS